MTKQNYVIIGGGIIGRFARLMIPGSVCYEKNAPGSKITCNYTGANICRNHVPELQGEFVTVYNLINGEFATPELIMEYKMSKNDTSPMSYGDIKQFVHKQKVYIAQAPEVEIQYGKEITLIDVFEKKIYFADGDCVEYGCIINTIPMPMLLSKINLFDSENSTVNINRIGMFKSKPIYYKEDIGKEVPKGKMIIDQIVDGSTTYRRIKYGNIITTESFYKFDGAICIKPGKIFKSECAEDVRNDLVLYNIYNYGRYALWRPNEFLHESFKNLRRFRERMGQIGYC